ncbi:MAG: ADP-ribosylglycohydrolase family protein [Clostridiales bacterium]|nr:ADP-ribosylglycohydrolase family protein [Clostridiales bacterium]
MKAWEREYAYMKSQVPKKDPDPDNEKIWASGMEAFEAAQDAGLRMLWDSTVPGSYARERVIVGGVQALENRGYEVPGAEALIERGIEALEAGDMTALSLVTCELQLACRNAARVDCDPYWRFTVYEDYAQYRAAVEPPPAEPVDVEAADFLDRTHAGWLGQVIGGAFGTAMEGYTTDNIFKTLGEVRDYPRKPNTYNDDITYELALLEGVERYGRDLTSDQIGLLWTALIPFGWSAEDVALQNLRRGIRPPESGSFNNPYREWIGAQMRGGVIGMLCPGDPGRAAELAWRDGCVSHHNNGILGEVYNAVLVSLAYVECNVRTLLKRTQALLPRDSQYYDVVEFAMQCCRQHRSWRNAWLSCERRFKKYNWVHAYPNVAAQIIALWYGNGDFDETLHLIGMCGQDVDCNAAQIMNALAVMLGRSGIPERWLAPFGDRLDTYVRGMKQMSLSGLAEWTVKLTKKLQ